MVFILGIESAQCPHDIPDVRADAKIGDPANIDGNLHALNLTTKDTKEHNGK